VTVISSTQITATGPTQGNHSIAVVTPGGHSPVVISKERQRRYGTSTAPTLGNLPINSGQSAIRSVLNLESPSLYPSPAFAPMSQTQIRFKLDI
jgi:hypothetical protein